MPAIIQRYTIVAKMASTVYERETCSGDRMETNKVVIQRLNRIQTYVWLGFHNDRAIG